MKYIKNALQKVYQRFSLLVLTVALFLVFLFLDYVLLVQTTSWEKFLTDNNQLFVFLAINLSVINNLLIAVALTFLVYVVEEKRKVFKAAGSNTIIGVFLSLVSVGCAVCGGFLLPIVGIAASLTVFPFQGLEIKALSIALLIFSINELSYATLVRPYRSGIRRYSWVFGLAVLFFIYFIPRLPWQLKQNFFGSLVIRKDKGIVSKGLNDNLFNEINPEVGYEINASFGQLGPKMLTLGVIDFDKFKSTYEKSGQPLIAEQLEILTKGTDKKVKITRENSYFLLNFFWAAGLGNKNKILTEGDMVKYGKDQVGNFASTGGWSLAQGEPMNFYAKGTFIALTFDQEALVGKVASQIYRPCCNNSTAFPDCNHGMALLGVLELMASNGATENQMFEAAKYFNAYWFPGNYYDLALYFKNKEGKKFSQIPGKIILGKDYSSSSGWQSVKKWLAEKGLIEKPPKQGGGCGV